MKRAMFIIQAVLLLCFCCEANDGAWKSKTEDAEFIHRSIKKVTDVIVYDIYSPPVASRTYAYICVAGYEALVQKDARFISLAGQLHQLESFPRPVAAKHYSYTLAAVQAILTVGKALVISEEKLAAFQEQVQREFRADGIPEDVFANSLDYGQQVASHVLAWASKDNYRQSRSLPKFAVSEEAATWKPTPPAYIKAIEPHWNVIRTFVIDSAAEFKPEKPPYFSTEKTSRFYKEALAVHDIGTKLTQEQNEIANFWDCNPYRMNIRGHVMYATKKISPNGHWVNITRLACKKVNADALVSAEAYACLSVALADCFISCWDEKYRSNVIRPETYINQYIDTLWVPQLQTPPFPEYTSGHSVVSAAAAVVLTKLFGDRFAYTDSTESEFGLPPRSFTSFKQAAEEAAISRFYGGIHYMPAIENGLLEGRAIGSLVITRLKMRKR
jgi:hypothetical protein